ncbi:hypothetical protein GCM10011490_00750 [Pseudoclavibacter endophyticus]|uniref:Type IV secretion protein Rhs n=1 Tax=Pseudoclavibacter endophyticus TaxID=1778590 RepID=A0A6H9WMF8_9MICO|nr:hypothetical protein F8O04_09335 [Pseudoclavibacter endophyticus]GGA54812.1 hypothetical protein GCM10011490_00750 [Pseudoclavibacter endophyticus]
MATNFGSSNPRRPLRERVKEAGGWFAYIDAHLIRWGGPAAVGPYETTPAPSAEERAKRACPLCGHPFNQHTFDRSGPKTHMHCPAGSEHS